MGETEGALPEIAKICDNKPKVLTSTGITICTFNSVADAKELEGYFESLGRSFFLFQVGASNTGYNIVNKSIHEGLFSEMESDLNNLQKKSDKLMSEINDSLNISGDTEEDIPVVNIKVEAIKVDSKITPRKAYYESLSDEEREIKINDIIEKGYSNLDDLDKKILEILKNISKKK